MQYKIGVFGSAVEDSIESLVEKAKKLGKALSLYDIIVVTGASSGLPYITALNAWEGGRPVWGYSPEKDLRHQKKFTPNANLNIYKKIFFIPGSFPFSKNPDVCKKYRNVISTANCDAGIIISGRWGSLNEFTNLYDMGKVIGILTNSGGIADEIKALNKKIHKPNGAKLVFADSPKRLVKSVMDELRKRE